MFSKIGEVHGPREAQFGWGEGKEKKTHYFKKAQTEVDRHIEVGLTTRTHPNLSNGVLQDEERWRITDWGNKITRAKLPVPYWYGPVRLLLRGATGDNQT